MLELNKVMLIGNLTRDPELSYLATGTALAKMGLAVNRSWKDKSGQWQREASFFDIDAWGATAEFCSKYLKKGKRIYVEGQLRQNTWEASDGTKRSQVRVNADRVQFADAPRSGEDAGSGEGEPAAEPAAYTAQAAPQRPSSPAAQAAPQAQPARQPFPAQPNPSAFDADQGSQESTADDLPF